MPVLSVGRKPDRLPEGKACRGRIHRDQAPSARARQQCCGQLITDTPSAECRPDVEAPYTHGILHDGFDSEAANPDEGVVQACCEQHLPRPIKPNCVRFPVGSEPFNKLITLGESFPPQHVDADGKFTPYDLVSAANYGTCLSPVPAGAYTRGRAKRPTRPTVKKPGGATVCL